MKATIEGIPSVVWAIVIVVGVVLAQEYLPPDSPYAEILVLAAVAALRALAVNASELDELVALAKKLQERLRAAYATEERSVEAAAVTSPRATTVPPEARLDLAGQYDRRKWVRWLVG